MRLNPKKGKYILFLSIYFIPLIILMFTTRIYLKKGRVFMNKFKILLLVLIVFVGCSKAGDPIDPIDPPGGDPSFQDLMISSGFDFSNTQEVEIDVTLPAIVDYSAIKSRIDIYYNHEGNKYPVSSVSCDAAGHFQGSVTIPSYITELVVENEAGNFTFDLSQQGLKSSAIIDYNAYYENTIPRDTTVTTKSTYQQFEFNTTTNTLANVSEPSLKTIANIITNGDFSTNDFGSQVVWNSPMTLTNRWNITSQLNGSTGQFDDDGELILRVSMPAAYYSYGGVTQLLNASSGDRITASADVRITGSNSKRAWIYIIPRNNSGTPLAYYSRQISSTGNAWRNYSIAASMPNGTVSVQILLWQHIYGGQIDYDNVVVTGPVLDADGDGINDEEDEYPNDSERAFNLYYPSSETYASIAFEDNWPGRGDYDFNDLVVDYQFKTITNASNAVKDMDVELRYRAIGATFLNGFGFEMNTTPNNVTSVSGTTHTEGSIIIASNGVEADQPKAVVIATDNAFNQLAHPGSGIGVNTTVGAPYVNPITQSLEIRFATAVAAEDIGTPPYNVFIYVNQDRGREIHLPDNEPTNLATIAYFGTEHDDSQIASSKYYKTLNNLPWAINVPSSFAYPNEKADVINAHLKFSDWAESSGAEFTDWYLDKTGYRNSSNIFQLPN